MRDPLVCNSGEARPCGPQGALPAVRPAGADAIGKRPPPSRTSEASGAVVSGDRATDVALYSLTFGEAPCVAVVGDRGTGKSTAIKAICRAYLKKSVGLVLASDKGGASGFEGQRRATVDDLRQHPMDRDPRAVVFTGDIWAGTDPDPEAVAAFAWQCAARRVPTLQAVDELKWAAKNAWWRRGVKWLPQSCSEGRKHGVGIIWASQSPQDAPREAIEEASLVICYRLAGLGLDRLEERNYLRGMDRHIVEGLPGDRTPPNERGRCVILRRGEAWDGQFYRYLLG